MEGSYPPWESVNELCIQKCDTLKFRIISAGLSFLFRPSNACQSRQRAVIKSVAI